MIKPGRLVYYHGTRKEVHGLYRVIHSSSWPTPRFDIRRLENPDRPRHLTLRAVPGEHITPCDEDIKALEPPFVPGYYRSRIDHGPSVNSATARVWHFPDENAAKQWGDWPDNWERVNIITSAEEEDS